MPTVRSFLVLLPLALFTVAASQPLGKGTPSPRPTASTSLADELFSRRAMRQARLLIQLRLLQLRDERLECVREAILRRLPPELRPTGSPAPAVKQSVAAAARKLGGALPFESEDCGWDSIRPGHPKPTV
jgi:hypothetical protein